MARENPRAQAAAIKCVHVVIGITFIARVVYLLHNGVAMSPGSSKYSHVVRVASLFAGGFILFLAVRWALVPADFGQYGFYRGGALADARAKPVRFAGQTACVDCHSDVADARKGARHERVRCEACHGPNADHANQIEGAKPHALNPRLLCLQCHAELKGKPSFMPQVAAADHGGDGPCTTCHKPHHPVVTGRP